MIEFVLNRIFSFSVAVYIYNVGAFKCEYVREINIRYWFATWLCVICFLLI